ncbi:phosphotransferase family protein [Pseudogracilibacillus sp. SO30301A]|uniref:phosphotransferase family protein n=1 Tax=Pseudogracilibacillus sp. SO30301A TaxID=3098291 RepID=UPI00300DE21F
MERKEKAHTYIKRIREVYPELEVYSAEFNHIGQNNDVLIVNNEIVFRFAKYQDGVERLEKETKILNMVGQYVSLPTPKPIYQQLQTKTIGKAFIGYKMIEGKPLWKSVLNNNDQPSILAKQLATFLRELHAIPIENVSLNLTHEDPHKEFTNLYVNFKEKLFPFMRQGARHNVSKRFESYLGNATHFEFKPCLIHGDFGPSNILYSISDNKVTGIIDFGGSCLGDPAFDFAGILSGYGECLLEKLLNYYPGIERVIERMRFYKSTFALQEALFGLDNNDQEAFQNGIKDYL